MLDYVWHRIKWLAEFTQNEFTGVILLYSHMHKSLGTPGNEEKKKNWHCISMAKFMLPPVFSPQCTYFSDSE